MADTVRLRVLRNVLVYRAGTIIPAVPRGQAKEWIRQGIAQEVPEPAQVETAAIEARDNVETADATPHRRKRR